MSRLRRVFPLAAAAALTAGHADADPVGLPTAADPLSLSIRFLG